MELQMESKLLLKLKASMEGIRICPHTQPPQLDFDPENTVASRPLNGLIIPIEMLPSLKKTILHCFQTV